MHVGAGAAGWVDAGSNCTWLQQCKAQQLRLSGITQAQQALHSSYSAMILAAASHLALWEAGPALQ